MNDVRWKMKKENFLKITTDLEKEIIHDDKKNRIKK